jgi:threonine synthase
MKFVSTRGGTPPVGLSTAIRRGIAGDGGLFVPDRLQSEMWSNRPASRSLAGVATWLITPFAEDDPLRLSVDDICSEAFNFPAPLVRLGHADGPAYALELFHGPTCAFKDFGARFLAAALERIRAPRDPKITILVATSGDTGGAVAAAFHGRPWVDVVLLYPRGLVSERQAHQLSCWGGNVRTFAVRGTFDDCQRIVKEAFSDAELSTAKTLSSANSINVGRLLPQMAYYASASLSLEARHGRPVNFIVPSGNLGNVTACVWARAIGLPIGEILLATNANRTVSEFFDTGVWRPRDSVATLANAMDVGNPSNMERLRALFRDGLRDVLHARLVTDDEIRDMIRAEAQHDYVWDPHGATAASVYHQLAADRKREPWVLAATAHPAKFNDIVEPLIGRAVDVPPALARLLELPRHEQELEPTLDALRARLVT